MSEYISVAVPKKLYRRARALADARGRSPDAIIVEALEQGLPPTSSEKAPLTEDEGEAAVLREMAAYMALHPALVTSHFGQHVAILDGQLIDHDENAAALYTRIANGFPDRFVWLAKVEAEPMPVIHSRLTTCWSLTMVTRTRC